MKDTPGRFVTFLNSLDQKEMRETFWECVRIHECGREGIEAYLLTLPPRATVGSRFATAWDLCICRRHKDFPGYAEWLAEDRTAEVAKVAKKGGGE